MSMLAGFVERIASQPKSVAGRCILPAASIVSFCVRIAISPRPGVFAANVICGKSKVTIFVTKN
jgi:hypothetical protein